MKKDIECGETMEEISLKSGEPDSESPWHVRVFNRIRETAVYLRWIVCC
jgi:hypothetical protein